VVHHPIAQVQVSGLEVDGGEGGVARVRQEIITTAEGHINDRIFDSL
jgi:hypothetical protein